jgi:CBS domain-containing protein
MLCWGSGADAIATIHPGTKEAAMRVKDVMTRNAKCIGPQASIADAAKLMRRLDIGCVPVGAEGQIVGMLTDRDITCRATAAGKSPKNTAVSAVMSKGVVTCHDTDTVKSAARLMEKKQIRRLPVLDSRKRLVGIVSVGDLAERSTRALAGEVMHEVCRPSH